MTADLAAAMELGAAVYAFVAARADEDEATATAATEEAGQWFEPGPGAGEWSVRNNRAVIECPTGVIAFDEGCPTGAQAAHIARNDPDRTRRRVAAVRAVLTAYEMSVRMLGIGLSRDKLTLLRAQAVIWEDHPDFDPAWRPGS